MIDGDGIRDDERLRRLEAVTDAALSRLDVSDLLDELLERVRDLLEVDTAAILLLDRHAEQLVATAAKGLEEEVRQGFRVAVGQGFAGRIAQQRRAMAIDEVTAADVANPILLEKGIKSLLGVPLLGGDEVLGVLHVGSFTPRRFSDDDVQLLELVADRASLATQARASRLDDSAAAALQRSLLPTLLPQTPGMQMAARYVPGQGLGVGGDWFDAFTLPSGWLGVVIGDVSGHGLSSAVVMGRIRSALRAYALVSEDPAEVLTMLDRKIQHFEAGSLTTALYATISPRRDVVRMSVAGHLPPVLAAPGEPSIVAPVHVDPPLGTSRRQRRRRDTVLDLVPGAALVCYTDGLVELRGRVIDVGIGALLDAVHTGPAEAVCRTVMAALAPKQPDDDVALLVICRDPA